MKEKNGNVAGQRKRQLLAENKWNQVPAREL